MRTLYLLALLFLASSPKAAERLLEFGNVAEGQTPPSFSSLVSGKGKPGEWKVVLDEVTPSLPALSPQAASASRQAVLAQLSQDPEDERFPLFVYEAETFGDFKLTTRLKTVRGEAERMAGVVFRLKDATNFYVLRISSKGNNFRFYKVVDGQRGTIIGPEANVPSGVWHEISVECKGSQITCRLNGDQAIPVITDTSFTSGKIGFWTKSDSVSYFGNTRIEYTPMVNPGQALARDTLKIYPRLLGIEIFVLGDSPGSTKLVGAGEEARVGKAGGQAEFEVITKAGIYCGKDKGSVSVVMPLRDRNGDVVAAARVIMKTFPGQTEKNAVERAAPIIKEMQKRVQSIDDLVLK
jgi:hypothetical protein